MLQPSAPPPTELGYLQLFLDPSMVDTFVTNTNLYAISRGATAWVPVTTEEMWRYLGIRIRQGIVPLPELHHYWEATYRDSYVSQLMPRDRFIRLHRYFHIIPPVPAGERQTVVEKTAPFYHQCQALFQQYYVPGAKFAVDETMIRFEGRSTWITVIHGKPTPVGYKIYTVASEGYLLGFRIFRGKGGYSTSQRVLHHTVVDLIQPWAGHHRTVTPLIRRNAVSELWSFGTWDLSFLGCLVEFLTVRGSGHGFDPRRSPSSGTFGIALQTGATCGFDWNVRRTSRAVPDWGT